MKQAHAKYSRFAILFFGVASISTAAIFIRLAQKDASSLVIATGRMVLSVIPLIPIVVIWHRASLTTISRKNIILSLLSGLILALHFATWITSLEFTTIASSVVIVCTTPIWVTLFGSIVYHEKVNKVVILGIMLALTGGMLVALSETCILSLNGVTCLFMQSNQAGNAAYGNLLAFLGALFAAGYLIIGKEVRKQVDLAPYALIVYGTAAIVLMLIIIFQRLNVPVYTPTTYFYILLLAIFPQLVGHSTLNWALKYLSTTYVAIAQMGEPVGSTILAIILFHEIPTPLKILGSILILIGIFTVSVKSYQQK